MNNLNNDPNDNPISRLNFAIRLLSDDITAAARRRAAVEEDFKKFAQDARYVYWFDLTEEQIKKGMESVEFQQKMENDVIRDREEQIECLERQIEALENPE